MQPLTIDLLVIGGGIHGVGVAVDAAGRGLRVVLCEKDDLASHTSSASSKLIHGGLRYLEKIELRLVHEALREREILLKKAPHLVRPLPFILPYDQQERSVWLIRAGLFLYDYLARREVLKGSKKLQLRTVSEGQPLKEAFDIGFRYMDCQTDDARLVVINALDAKARGATLLTRTSFESAVRDETVWTVTLRHAGSNQVTTVHAKAIVNAAGPWVWEVLQKILPHSVDSSHVRLIQGSHLIVPRCYRGDHAYIFQHSDHRVVFAIPYHGQLTLIGTTDVPYRGSLEKVHISAPEIHYLLDVVNHYFVTPLTEKDICWNYSGVRALYGPRTEQAQAITREYHLDFNTEGPPIVSIVGGKMTTYRALAERVLSQLKPFFPHMKKPWTEHTPLPGGDLGGNTFEQFLSNLKKEYPWLPDQMAKRYAESYGALSYSILLQAKQLEDLGGCWGADLYAAEVDYLVKNEWVQTSEDLLWRRTQLGLFLSAE